MPRVPNKEYWTKRSELALIANEKTALQYEKELAEAYKATLSQIKKEISTFYQKYADESGISITGARNRLKPDEKLDFNQQAKVYLDEVERLGDNAFVSPYKEQLRKLSGKAYMSRMDELKANIQHNLETLAVGHNDKLGKTMTQAYEDGYFKTMFDVQKQAGVGVSFTAPGGKQLEAAVREKWNGQNYSDRIWNDKNKMIMNLEQTLAQDFVRGKNPKEVARTFATKMGTSYSNAVRLIRTEVNYISNKGTMQAYVDSEVVDRYEFLSTLDSRTSDICRELDGKNYEVKEGIVGVNLPPLHPHCRSTTIPFFPDDEIAPATVDRIARDKDGKGKSYRLGEDVTFHEWVDKYASPEYKERVHKERAKYLGMNGVPPTIKVRTPLSFEGKNITEVYQFLNDEDIINSGYAPDEIIAEFHRYTGRDISNIYIDPTLHKIVERFGLATVDEMRADPFLMDIKVNQITRDQAKNRMLVGEPVEDLFGYMEVQDVSKKVVLERIQEQLMLYKKGFTPEELFLKMNEMYQKTSDITPTNSIYKDLNKKSKDVTGYKAAIAKVKSTYAMKDVSENALDAFVSGRFKSIADAVAGMKNADATQSTAEKATKEAADAEGITEKDWKKMQKKMSYMSEDDFEKFKVDLQRQSKEYQKVFINTIGKVKKIGDLEPDEGAHYRRSNKTINITKEDGDMRNRNYGIAINTTIFHEMGHAIDDIQGKTGKLSALGKYGFITTMDTEFKKLLDPYSDKYRELRKQINNRDHKTHGLQDVIEGAKYAKNYKGEKLYTPDGINTQWGHGKEYWERGDTRAEMASELFAHLSSAAATPEERKIYEKYIPDTLAKFEEIIKNIADSL